MNRTVFWDLDETLVFNTAFTDARREFCELMAHTGFSQHEADQTMEFIDSAAAKVHGFGDKHRFGNSMVETYQELCLRHKTQTKNKVMTACHKIGMDAHNKPVQRLPNVEDTLKLVRHLGYNQYIVTKGNVQIQEDKIFSSKLDKLVEGWFVYDQKTITEMYDVLKATKSAARYSYFIGNSPKSDVNPAYLAGMGAIYIPYATTWVAELEDLESGVIVVDNVSEVPDVISR